MCVRYVCIVYMLFRIVRRHSEPSVAHLSTSIRLLKFYAIRFGRMLLCYSNRAFICYALVCVLPTYERICACHVRIDIKRLQWQRERKGNNRHFHALKNWNAYTSTLGRILAMKFSGSHVFRSCSADRWVSERASKQTSVLEEVWTLVTRRMIMCSAYRTRATCPKIR